MGETRDVLVFPRDTRVIVEELLERLGCQAGHWRVQVEAKDGRCLNVDVSEVRIPASELSRFDR